MIRQCPVLNWTQDGPGCGDIKRRVVYLTVHESLVPVGETQRRPGVHIERPGPGIGGRVCKFGDDFYFSLAWGLGTWASNEDLPVDGIYMASNVAESCAIWPVLIDRPEEVTDRHGGLDPTMVAHLGPAHALGANELVWFTDRTPHQALPLRAPETEYVYRQFFRLVAGPIGVWHSKHNTPNPLGILPDATISDEDKFANE
jgi:hypothetical protein